MLKLIVTEKVYKKGANWWRASEDEAAVLIGSVDLDGDDLPVEERNPGDYYFTRDFVLRLYDIKSDTEDEADFARMEFLREMAMGEPNELRYWFHDVPVGTHVLLTSWSEPDADGDGYLQFDGLGDEFND